ncbi:MAG TPA: hypothetical protein VFN29_06320 [Chiayiivirga sp.]|nr:hypothetical protein [Chiayiivirga sp.]
MTHRLLLTCALLLLAANAQAGTELFHSASGETSGPCPSTALNQTADPSASPSAIVAPAASEAASPASSHRSNAPSVSRPSLRWHSFLPGMMK